MIVIDLSINTFLCLLYTGTVLSGLCWDGVEYAEREGREMLLQGSIEEDGACTASTPIMPLAPAMSILRLLLYGEQTERAGEYMPFCSRRRGRYFERLCIDLEHSGFPEQALQECSRAINDKSALVKV